MKQSPTQLLTKITPYTLKRIAFTTSRASEIKTRAKKALSICHKLHLAISPSILQQFSVSTAMESPQIELLIDASYVLR